MRRQLLSAGATAVLSALLILAQANLLAVAFARIVLGAPPERPPVAVLGALAGVFALRAGVAWLRESMSRAAAARIKQGLRHALFVAIQRLGPARLHRERGGELATVAGAGLDGLDAYLTDYLPQLMLATVVPIAVLARVAVADPISAGIIAATLPLIPVFGALVGKHTRAAARGQWRALGELGGHFLDVLRGLPTLRAFGRAQHQVAVVGRTAQNYRVATMRTLRIAFLSGLALELVATLSVALIAVPVGLRLLDGNLKLATGLLVLFLAPEAYRPLRDLGSAFHAAAAGRAATERAFAVIDQSRPDEADHTQPAPVSATEAYGSAIELRQVTVGYPGTTVPALRDVNLHVDVGERIALIGPSGAGKSTLLSLLLGFLAPTDGSVLLGGTDLRDLREDEHALARWRARVAWVPQRPHLFAGTIGDNITLGADNATLRHIRRAAQAASAAGFVEALPAGYGTVLGDNGAGLSGGQRQRIALARAFYRKAPVLLLDEPSASIDATSEAAVLEATRALSRGKTTVIATHRPALLDDVDRVFAVVDGSVSEVGTALGIRTVVGPRMATA